MAGEIITTKQQELGSLGFAGLPTIISAAGERASFRFIEFFTANIRNPNTRVSYGRAVREFCQWCEDRGFALERLNPVIVAGYIELLGQPVEKNGRGYSLPSVKQHLAAIRMLFDYLVTGGVLPMNPASSVRGPKYSIKRGKTPVLSAEEARQLLDAIETDTIIGLRDRALIGVMVFSFSRISAAVSMRIEDYFQEGNVSLAASGGGFIDADLSDLGMVGFGAGRIHIVGDDAPNQRVVLVDQTSHREDRHGLGQHHDQRLEQQGEAAVGSGPGNRHAVNAAVRTLHPGGAGVKERLVLEKVQVPPGQFVRVIGLRVNPANRARKDAAPRKIQMDIQTSGRLVKRAAADHPWRQQAQGCLKQFILVHPRAPPRRIRNRIADAGNTTLTPLPTRGLCPRTPGIYRFTARVNAPTIELLAGG